MSSARTALLVLEGVADGQPIGVTEISRRLELPKSSAQRALTSLHECGWIRPVGGARATRWVLTPKTFVVGSSVGGEVGLAASARPAMNRLHEATRESIHLLVPNGTEMVLVEHLESTHALRSSYPLGMRAPMSASSSGKAYLASLPLPDVDEIVAQGLVAMTPASVTDPRVLAEELEQIRRRGYATNHGELTRGITSVAAPIYGADGRAVASISVSLPAERMGEGDWERLGSSVMGTAEEIGVALARDGGHGG